MALTKSPITGRMIETHSQNDNGVNDVAFKAQIPKTQIGTATELNGNKVLIKSNAYNPKSTQQLQTENAQRKAKKA